MLGSFTSAISSKPDKLYIVCKQKLKRPIKGKKTRKTEREILACTKLKKWDTTISFLDMHPAGNDGKLFAQYL